MNIAEIRKLLKNPLVEALLSDVAVVGGFDLLKRFVNDKNDKKDPAQQSKASVPLKIPKVFLQLTIAQRLAVAPWLKNVSHRDRRKIEDLEEERIKELLELSEDQRDAFLSILPDSPTETIKSLLQQIELAAAPALPKTRQLVKDFGDWGRTP